MGFGETEHGPFVTIRKLFSRPAEIGPRRLYKLQRVPRCHSILCTQVSKNSMARLQVVFVVNA